jgi:SRSO17 transposase
VLSRLPRNAPVWLDRLIGWLEPFEVCFTHVAQRGAFRRYLLGLLSDSRRKSMSAMLERVSDPGTYQAFQHFITDAPWSAERVWRTLRARMPACRSAASGAHNLSNQLWPPAPLVGCSGC